MKTITTKRRLREIETIKCNLCGADDYQVLPTSNIRFDTGQGERLVICRQCGLLYLNPRWTEASYRDFYRAEYRENVSNASSAALPEQERQWQLVRDIQQRGAHIVEFCRDFVRPSDRVLEVGCSNGGILRPFQLAGYINLVGVEPNIAESHFARESLGLDVITGFLEDANLQSESFDLILIVASIDHFLNPLAYLQNLHSLSRSGGYLYVDTADALEWIKCGLFIPKMDHAYYFKSEVMYAMLRRAGWEVVKFEAYNPFTYTFNNRENWKRFDRVGIRFLGRRSEPDPSALPAGGQRIVEQVVAPMRFYNSLPGRLFHRLRGRLHRFV